jgi:tetratricopeptide (TPR) repeat protein
MVPRRSHDAAPPQTPSDNTELERLKSAIEREPANTENWLAYGEALAERGDITTAIALIEFAMRSDPNNLAFKNMSIRLRKRADADVLHRRAALYHRRGQLIEAIASYRKALIARPEFVEAEVNLASALQAFGSLTEAVNHLHHVIAQRPQFAAAHFNLGNALAAQGDDPCDAYRTALALDPGYTDAWYNLALAYEAAGQVEAAEDAYRGAINTRPTFAAAYLNLGVLLFTDRRYEEALAAYDAALAVEPESAAAHNNRGNVLRVLGAMNAAADAYRAAIASDPQLAEAHNNLGNLLRGEGDLVAAVDYYRRAMAATPHFPEPSYNLGYVLAELGQIREGFEWLTRHARQVCVAQTADTPSHKHEHDEQQRFHIGPDRPDPQGQLWLEGGDPIAGDAVRHHPDCEAKWTGQHPVLVIDDFLTPAALAGLRVFCANSTIWREIYAGNYLGAFPEHGVACPLLAQIAQELKEKYLGIFQDYPLLQLWAFKYGSRLKGIPLHADFAAVNVNFWITQDKANLDPQSGGLVIWDKPAPPDWDFAKYNMDPDAGRHFLESQSASSTVIPYRANRAVIFDSDLFHETDIINFAPGYTNRRINITLLFGRRALSARSSNA